NGGPGWSKYSITNRQQTLHGLFRDGLAAVDACRLQRQKMIAAEGKYLEFRGRHRAYRRRSRTVVKNSDFAEVITRSQTAKDDIVTARMMIHDLGVSRHDDVELIRRVALSNDDFARREP